MRTITVPLGWDAIRGQPQYRLEIPEAPTEILVSDTMGARRDRIWGPLQLGSHLAVEKAMRALHDADGARYHRARPTLKACPYDPACRFV